MKAILLCAGLGTRLRPLTDNTPKCLMKINGKPLLEIWLEQLTNDGISNFLINTHHLSDKITDYVMNSKYKKNINLVHETELLGTAGTLISNLDFFDEKDGLLIHADNFCSTSFLDFINIHLNRPKTCEITMMTFKTEEASKCGIVVVDKNKIVREFYEKSINPPGNLANGAIYILSQKALNEIRNQYPSAKDFSIEIIPRFLNRIYSYEISDHLIDIGTIENYRKANEI